MNVRRLTRAVVAVAMAMPIALSTSAVASPLPGTVESLTYGSGLIAHPYLVYTPKGYTPTQRLPLLVMLHGCQTTAYEQMEANLYNPLADQKHFVVVYPDTDQIEADQPGPLQRCFQFFNPIEWQRGQGDGAAVAAITQSVISGWNIDPQRVYLMGMSAGAFLTADMAATYPDIYAAVGENAGGAYEDPECTLQSALSLPVTTTAQAAWAQMGPRARVVPKIVIGGDADQGIPPACADQALEQSIRTNNLVIDGSQTAPISLTPTTVQHLQKPGGDSYTVSSYVNQFGCVVGQRYLVHGMNHFWSGGSSDPKWKDFTDPRGPSAAIASWNFFSTFTLGNTASASACAPAPAEHTHTHKRPRATRRHRRTRAALSQLAEPASGQPVDYCAQVPIVGGIPPWGFHTGAPITGATGSYARGHGDINLTADTVSGILTLFASYNGVRSDSVQVSFPAACGDHDHLYHGPEVDNQVPPLRRRRRDSGLGSGIRAKPLPRKRGAPGR